MPANRSSLEWPHERAEDHAWVIRGGGLDADGIWKNHGRVWAAHELHGICATAWHGGIVADGEHMIRAKNPRYCYALVSELRDIGCDVIREPGHDWPDALILLPGRPTLAEIEVLRAVFFQRDFRDNPNAGPRKGAA